jgi:hypothetical protein
MGYIAIYYFIAILLATLIAVHYQYIPAVLKFQGTTISRSEFHEMRRFANY